MAAKVKFMLSPNVRLTRRGSASPVECSEKKSPLLRRGSWSPNIRLLRRASDSNFLKDSEAVVSNAILCTYNCFSELINTVEGCTLFLFTPNFTQGSLYS